MTKGEFAMTFLRMLAIVAVIALLMGVAYANVVGGPV
jgi:hypothetical protein